MRVWTILRISPGAWLTPLMLGVAYLYVSQSITFAHREPYELGLTARAMNVLGLVVPVFAAAAAWEGARLRRSGVWDVPMVRSRAVVAAWSIGPAVLGGVVVITSSAIQVLAFEGLFLPNLLVLGIASALLIAHASAGFAIGLLWPRSIALPAVVLVSIAWFVVPRVFDPPWLMHPFGASLELCCGVSDVLQLSVAASIALVSLGVVGMAATVIMRWPVRRAELALVGLVVLAATMWSFSWVAGLPLVPTTARSDASTVCADGPVVRVCAWPEHAPLLSGIVPIANEVASRWKRFGIDVPTDFVEGAAGDGAKLPISIFAGRSDVGFTKDLARAMVAGRPECSATQPWPSAVAGEYLWVWLATVAGVPPSEIIFYEGTERPDALAFPDTPPGQLVPVRPLVDRVLALSPRAQTRWAVDNLRALQTCFVVAPLDHR